MGNYGQKNEGFLLNWVTELVKLVVFQQDVKKNMG